MDNASYEIISDLTVNHCPLGCNRTCAGNWINKSMGHRIICKCACKNHKKQEALERVGGSATNAFRLNRPSTEVSEDG